MDEVEEGLRDALDRLRDEEAKEEEKRERELWQEIDVPFTLKDGLGRLKKLELDDMRKRLGVKGVSGLKKQELIQVLSERIPEIFKQMCLLWDAKRFHLILKIARNGGYKDAPDLEEEQIAYFRSTGVVFTGMVQGKKVLAVPEELIEPLLSLGADPEVNAMVERNTEWIKLTLGLLYYYGTLSLAQLEEMLPAYMKGPFSVWEYMKVIHDVHAYQDVLHIDDSGYSNRRVFDPEKVKQEHRNRPDLDFYPFSKAQLLKAGEPDFVERNKSYMQLVNFMTKHFQIDQEEADSLAEECVYATRIGDTPNNILQFLSYQLEFERKETVEALMEKVVNVMNHTREWFLKGYMSSELVPRESLEPLSTRSSSNPAGNKQKKVGRNDLCPCGSGKKYKKCCGR